MNEPQRPRRRPLRAPAYDYAAPGAYFITIVTQHRICHLGTIELDAFCPTPAGDAIAATWRDLASRFPQIELDHFVVMPNHVHGVLWIVDRGAPHARRALRLGDIVGAFKSLSARGANAALGRTGPLWQRNYYERIVRDETELAAIRTSIEENPLRWALDAENPTR